MKAPRRSFWAIVGLAATSVTAAVAGATWASREVLACWWAPLAGAHFVPGAVCARPVWGIGYRAWIPALLLVGVAVVSVAFMVVLGVRQALATRALRAGFGPKVTTPETLASAACQAGAYRLVLVEDDRQWCVCEGLWRPRVVISTGLVGRLSGAQLLAVLAHEASHAAHHDPLGLLMARVAGAGLWFLPLRRRLLWVCEMRAELAADADAMALAGRSSLAGALLAMSEPARPASSPMAYAASRPELIELRLAAMWRQGLPKACVIARLVAANAFVLGLLTGALVAWAGPPSYKAPIIGHVHVLKPNFSKNRLILSPPPE